MAEGDPSRSRHVVAPVVETDSGREVRVVEFEHAAGDESGVEAVADRVDTYRGDYEPQRAGTILAASERDKGEAARAKRGHHYPKHNACCLQASPAARAAVPPHAQSARTALARWGFRAWQLWVML